MSMNEMDRRTALQAAAAGTLLPWLPMGGWAWTAAAPPRADAVVAGKDPRLIVHGAEPVEIETPLELLRTHRLTPPELMFVRNNQQLEDTLTLAPPRDPGAWTVALSGELNQKAEVRVADLAKLEQVEVEMVLQCSGNGRYFFNQIHPSKPGDKLWACGALANVRFGGVPLPALLKHLNLKPTAAARFVTALGKDRPLKDGIDDFEHSVPLDDALARSFIALRLNGAPLPAIHGGPARIVTPGYYGTVNVKWVDRLVFAAEESTNYHHERRYRTPKEPVKPGTEWVSTLENSDANWRMRIRSVIWNPLADTKVAAGRHKIQGVAWNDGACAIDAVELSFDQGKTWKRTQLERPQSPFAWHPWQYEADLAAGTVEIWARAIDALGRSQPLDGGIGWNPGGYAWAGVHKIRLTAG
ncbi:MAG TPA: molybdopterin-dependent oxidoreductase [Gemmatales bacterium]|nr:molybdopterin-dependent oxidoreductase [Gemmatales bacterium]HMP58686.1 molybdopterin-dependent oxidoreductase [Gemmatales bacterium]